MSLAVVTEDFTTDPAINEPVPSGVAFYRGVMPTAVIHGAQMGRPRFSVKEGIGIDDGHYGIFGFDTVLVKLIKHKSFLKWIELGKALGQRIVVDVDDYFEGLHPTNSAYTVTDPSHDKVSNREWMEKITLAADTITVSTPFLRDIYAPKHHDVRLVRNAILPSMFTSRIQKEKPIIGWMGAVLWRSEDLETMTGWLPKFIEDHRLKFHHSGHIDGQTYAYEQIGIPRNSCSVQGMVPMNRLRKLMNFDIGLVPLNDVPFNYAKSGLKGLEYAASGIPFVASNLPEYALLASEGIGQVAGSDEEWTEIMGGLLSRKNRMRAAEKAKAEVLASHTIYSRSKEWNRAVMVPKDQLEETA